MYEDNEDIFEFAAIFSLKWCMTHCNASRF